jgi:hypothetical protein
MTAPSATDAPEDVGPAPRPETSVLPTTARALDRDGIRWLLLRPMADGHGDVDVLIHPDDDRRAREVLRELGWVEVPTVGRGSHEHHISLDPTTGRSHKLDVVTALEFGPYQEWRTGWGPACLERRQRHDGYWVPDRGDAFWLTLLHALLDRQDSERRLHDALRVLPEGDPTGGAADAVAEALPPGWTTASVLAAVRRGDVGALAVLRDPLGWRTGPRSVVRARRLWRRTIRRLARPILRRRRRFVVALLGPDGAGKSRLAAAGLQDWPFPVATAYAGLYPLEGSSPASPAGLRFLRRLVASRRRAATNSAGATVLLDRHPYDLLVLEGAGSTLKRRLQRWAIRLLVTAPDLVVVLDAPAELLFARSGEHSVATLERQRARYATLPAVVPRRTRVAVIDASAEPEEVRHRMMRAVWEGWTARRARPGTPGRRHD